MKTTPIRLILLLLSTAFGIMAVTNCNTMHGLGRDVEHTGEEIQEQAR